MNSLDELLVKIQKLNIDEQMKLLEELTSLIKSKSKMKKHSILELQGLGKELWTNIDIIEYINQERESWSG